MAIAFDNATDADLGNVGSGNFAFLVGSGSDRKLIVFVAYRGPTSSHGPSVTYNGVAMTEIGTGQHTGGSGVLLCHAFELSAPDPGSNSVAISLASGAPGSTLFGAAIALTGVDQGSAYDAQGGYGAISVTNVTGGSDISTTVPGAWVLDGIIIRNNATITVDGSQTERTNQVNGGVTVFATSTEGPIASPGAVSMDWSWSTTHQVAQKIVALAPSAGGASGQPMTTRWGGTPHMGTTKLSGGIRGGVWGRTRDGLIVPRRSIDRKAA